MQPTLLTLTSYSITKIDPIAWDYTITFTFSDNTTSTQTLALDNYVDQKDTQGTVISSAASQLDQAVKAYAVAYMLGLQQEQAQVTTVPASIQSLIGKTLSGGGV